MLFEDTYKTIEKPAEGKFSDRGSKFLAYAYPVISENELKERLTGIKLQHPKANHHCWALRLGIDRSVFRINDDGEPSGTAGRPILNTLLSRDLSNIAVVVVRYFGGILLGVPGLISAYKTVTEDAIKQAVIIERTVDDIYTIRFNYPEMNHVMRLAKEENLAVISQDFNNDCSIQVAIRKSQVNQVISKFNLLNSLVIKYDYSR